MKPQNLTEWRRRIDNVDEQILILLAERKQIAKSIATVKMSNKSDVLDSDREMKVLYARQNLAVKLGLKKELVASLMVLLMRYSKEAQKEVFHNSREE